MQINNASRIYTVVQDVIPVYRGFSSTIYNIFLLLNIFYFKNGEAAIHMASRVGNLAVVKLLIKEKANVARRCKVRNYTTIRVFS